MSTYNERLKNRIITLEHELARREMFGEDVYEDGNVICFQKQFIHGGRLYDYVILKCAGRWYTSGPQRGATPMTWEEVIEFWREGVEPSSIHIVAAWKPLFA